VAATGGGTRQGMNAHRRISVGEHVAFDDQSWQYAFQFMRDFIDVQSLVLEVGGGGGSGRCVGEVMRGGSPISVDRC
jgi:hypothetical protein